MTQDRRRRAEAVFQRALDLPTAEREGFVRAACADDPSLLEDALRLLDNDPGTIAAEEPDGPIRLAPRGLFVTDPQRVGPYRVLQRLGAGGFGVVYEVEQVEPIRRRLALKLLKAGMDTEEVLARFEAERQALALMDHPNIARVVDAGATEQGRPYFAMELVRGDPITVYCDREKLGIDARIQLFLTACRAVQHAHQKGILHRDLKPSNILVTRIDGEPQAKIIDFGIAKALSAPLVARTLHTVSGQVMGTPAYMSPEQADRSGVDVDTASDVHSLGVVLYELLCGCLPVAREAFDRTTPDGYGGVMRRARRRPPSARFEPADEDAIGRAWWRDADPWHLRARLRGDLDWIVMRAIASDRSRRYQSVQEFQEDILRSLRDEPVRAGPPGLGYRAGKFARRHRVALGFVSVALFGLLAAGAGLTWALLESNEQRRRVEQARAESEAVLEFLSSMLASARPSDLGRDPTVREILDRSAEELASGLGDRPLVEARLRAVIGVSYRELGRFDEAAGHLGRALDIYRARTEPHAEPRLLTLREMGVLERSRGDYARAESLLAQVLRVRRESETEDPVVVGGALNDLASVYVMAERDEESIPLLEDALRRVEPLLPPDDLRLSEMESNLGLAYQAVGRYEEAEAALLRSLAIESRRNGPDHVYTHLAGQNLAAFYRETGRLDEAEPFYRRAYEATIEIFGPDNPTTVRSRSNYALLLSDLGRFDAALPLAVEVVSTRERTLGPENPSTLASRINLALLHLRRNEVGEALRSSRETAARCGRALGDDHLYTLIAESLHADALREDGRAREAEARLRSVLARGEKALSPDHWRMGRWLARLGVCLADLGREIEAEDALRRGHAILSAHFGDEDHRTREVIESLVLLLESTERAPEAQQWRARLASSTGG